MASNRTYRRNFVNHDFSQLICDVCDSEEIIETTDGYTCRNCGIVLEIQKLQYTRPYNQDIIQYARGLGRTQMGTKRERKYSSHSVDLERQNRRNLEQDNYRSVIQRAKIQISRLFEFLDLPELLKEDILKKFKIIYSKFRSGTKYRNPEKLVAIIIYYILKFRNIARSQTDFLEYSGITKKEFNNFRLQIRKFLPKYEENNRQELILRKIYQVRESFDLDMPFYYFSKKILFKLWNIIKNTKDDVIAGLCSGISVLCAYKEQVNVNSICKLLGIQMSTIQAQVQKKIFEQFRVKGFTTLVRSSDLLREIMSNLGIVEREQKEKTPEIVEVVLGNATPIYSAHDDIDFYIFALKDIVEDLILLNLNVFKPLQAFNENYYTTEKPVFDITLWKLLNGKGPPTTFTMP